MKSVQQYFWRVLLAVVFGLFATSSWADPPDSKSWQMHDKLKPVIGEDGKKHEATCSGYPGTDPEFKFWTRKGKSDNLLVYFEGGGACWDNFTCTFPITGSQDFPYQFFAPAIPPGLDPSQFEGIFKADNPANPVKDWTVVYIPYCTGDLHSGSATKLYFDVRGAVGLPPVPNFPPAFELKHRGFDNFMVVLDWMKKHVDDPKKVLVAGVSAGGYGATANFPWLDRTFRHAHKYLMADASQGVTTHNFDIGTISDAGRQSWNLQLPPWVFGPAPWLGDSADLIRDVAQALPRAKLAQFTTAQDGVQSGFYRVQQQLNGPPGTCPDPKVDWNQRMLPSLSLSAAIPNYRYYLASGEFHTLLGSANFYTENSAGPTFSSWLGNMLKGGQWEDAYCATCLTPITCPPH